MPGPHALASTQSSRRHLLADAAPRRTASLADAPLKKLEHNAVGWAEARCGAPNVRGEAVRQPGGWRGFVRLRADQGWMADAIRERGVPCFMPGEEPA